MDFQEFSKNYFFNGTIIWTAFALSFPVEPVIFCLYLNKSILPGKLPRTAVTVKTGSSL